MNSKIFDKFNERATQEFRPLQASLELTYRCNERCTHCYIEEFKDDPKRILDKDGWFKVLRELRDGGSLYLILMGGEPLLSPHFNSVAEKATDMGFHVSMISNGLKIRQASDAERLRQVGLRLVTFSLYSLDPLVHDKMTAVRGSHQNLMRAIELCLQAGIQVSLNGLLTEANCHGIFDLYDWSIEKGLELKVDPNLTPKLNGDLAPTEYRASRESLLWFYRERTRRWKASVPVPSLETSSDYVCNAAKGKCAVTPYGELLPCIEIREPFGSLVTDSFSDLWQTPSALKWRSPKIADMSSKTDTDLYSFCDHCPGMAKNENGKPFEVTAYTALVAEVKRQVHREFTEREVAQSL